MASACHLMQAGAVLQVAGRLRDWLIRHVWGHAVWRYRHAAHRFAAGIADLLHLVNRLENSQ